MDLVGQVAFAARVVVAGTLLVAAWAKLRDLPGFAAGVGAYGLLPPGAERFVVWLVPAAEVLLGVVLLAGWALPWSAWAAAALLAAFGLAILVAAHRGQDIPCHCFGASPGHRVGIGAALRSALLVVLAMVAGLGPSVQALLFRGGAGTDDEVLLMVSLVAVMTSAVVLAEPLVLTAQGVYTAWRRAPELRAAEAVRRRTCATATADEGASA